MYKQTFVHASALLREHVSLGGARVRGSVHRTSAPAELCWLGVPGCLFACLTALRWLSGRLRQCARFLRASSTQLGTSHPSPGPSRAAPPSAWEASPRPRLQCFNPYPLLLLPDSGLHPGENLDRLLYHLLPGSELTLDLSGPGSSNVTPTAYGQRQL